MDGHTFLYVYAFESAMIFLQHISKIFPNVWYYSQSDTCVHKENKNTITYDCDILYYL